MDAIGRFRGGGLAEEIKVEDRHHDLIYQTRYSGLPQTLNEHYMSPAVMAVDSPKPLATVHGAARPSPKARDQKQVTFELLLPVPQHRARLPMRVMISRHDTTDSIITTVKNFYGLYEGPGVSFHDRQGNILIAAYDNFDSGMTVYVKVSPEELPPPAALAQPKTEQSPRSSASPKKPKLGAPFEMRPPAYHPSRSGAQ